MSKIPTDYIQRCYAGWLAKLIGIQYGAPVEGWTYEKIKEVYGEIDGYLVDYHMFAADDDSNGPMIFIRALNDAKCTRDITPQDIANAWLNYAPYEHGFYWWGGYGKSTEHTAYLNLRAGIPAPRSGSVEQNGETIAEQIGGQIFIDTWGLVLPNQPELAAEYAGKAASVSHGGNAIYGGQYVAVMISLAFTAKSIRDVVEGALNYIPADCEYARVVRDVVRFYDEQQKKDWRQCFMYVKEHWGYSRYTGGCHIIPNIAVMILALMYGEENFDRTLSICNMCGWDTDCNVGNVATVMGVFCGIDAIDMKKWRNNINDTFAVSSVLGCLNIMDVPWCVAYLSDLAYRMAGEEMPEEWQPFMNPSKQFYHFRLPGSTHGFQVQVERDKKIETQCINSGKNSLKVSVNELDITESFRVCKRTYLYPHDLHDNRYDPAFTPILYPGMTVTATIEEAESCSMELYAAAYIHDGNNNELVEGERVRLCAGKPVTLSLKTPSNPHMLIDEAGVRITAGGDCCCTKPDTALVYLSDVSFTGKACYDIDFRHEHMEVYTGLHREVSQFTYLKGNWTLSGGRLMGSTNDYGEAYTGDIRWDDYTFEGSMERACESEVALNFRVQGAIRSYALAMDSGKLMLKKNSNEYATLAEVKHETEIGKSYRFKVECKGSTISVYENGEKLLEYDDRDNPYLTGCIGCSLRNGARGFFDDFVIE